jgi:hypothetical protein
MRIIKKLVPALTTWCGLNCVLAQTWMPQTNLPVYNYITIASSADGTKLVAAGQNLYTSTNSGVSWIQATNAPDGPYVSYFGNSLASSADGAKLVVADFNGNIYTSPDSGASWIQQTNLTADVNLASSADGTKLVADAFSGGIYTSTNSGVTWVQATNAPAEEWYSVASSANGVNLAAVGADSSGLNTPVYTSTNSGTTWTPTSSPSNLWICVVSSADGNKLVAVPQFTNTPEGYFAVPIWLSTNQGTTWTPTRTLTNTWSAVASSADGTRLVAVALDGEIFTSTDSGANWTSNTVLNAYYVAIASSADGNKLVVADHGSGTIFTSQTTPAPLLHIVSSNVSSFLSWIVPSATFVLQRNLELTTANWVDLTNAPVLNLTNLQEEVTLPLTNGSGYYRLATQ